MSEQEYLDLLEENISDKEFFEEMEKLLFMVYEIIKIRKEDI